jgi:hypothetical protein
MVDSSFTILARAGGENGLDAIQSQKGFMENKTPALAGVTEQKCFKRLASACPKLSSRVAFTRDLLSIACETFQKQIPRKSDSG